MAHVHTHYDNLKVARDAPPEVIRAAYKTLCQKYHPDRNGNSAEAIRVIQLINSAYAVLADPVKRREHDEWIARAEAEAVGVRQSAPSHPGTGQVHRRKHRRSRRKSALDLFHPRHRTSQKLLHALHRAFSMFDSFSRKLFRKS